MAIEILFSGRAVKLGPVPLRTWQFINAAWEVMDSRALMSVMGLIALSPCQVSLGAQSHHVMWMLVVWYYDGTVVL